MTEILLILLTAALGASLVAGEIRTRHWKALHEQVREIYSETFDRLVEAEANLERTQGELRWLKELFARPLVATLNDAQASNLTQAVLTYLASLGKPDLLN